jgi:DnaJ-class molecular chaperone
MEVGEKADRVVKRTIEPHVCICRVCSGSGKVEGNICRQCKGSGRVICSSVVTTYVEPFEGKE